MKALEYYVTQYSLTHEPHFGKMQCLLRPFCLNTYGKHSNTLSSKKCKFLMCWGLTPCQPLWVILCCLPEKGRKGIEEIVGEMTERDREERGTRIVLC